MARKNLVSVRLAAHLMDHGLSPEDFGETVGLSGMTIRRILEDEPGAAAHIETKFKLARALREDPSTLWPVGSVIRKRTKAAA